MIYYVDREVFKKWKSFFQDDIDYVILIVAKLPSFQLFYLFAGC